MMVTRKVITTADMTLTTSFGVASSKLKQKLPKKETLCHMVKKNYYC